MFKQFCTLIASLSFMFSMNAQNETVFDPVLVVHGGAGNGIVKGFTDEATEQAYVNQLEAALKSGFKALQEGQSAIEAVVIAIKVLEDTALFNAGRGSVFTNEGKNEMDASIMEGNMRNAGAIAGVITVKNPIEGARAVLEHSEHVFLVGKGAEQFVEQHGVEIVDPSYFFTDKQFDRLKRIKEREGKNGDQGNTALDFSDLKMGTVGAVALDKYGNLAAGTSTGGMTNKKYGRVGDSPVIGAGTYADNTTCAISATGHGEFFIRAVVAHEIASLMKYKGLSLAEATEEVVMKQLKEIGGDGGVIGVDQKGNLSMTFNTRGMFRGYIRKVDQPKVFMYGQAEE